jgi:long-chain acyl-CoA synthetase
MQLVNRETAMLNPPMKEAMRREVLYGNRVVSCYPVRPHTVWDLLNEAVRDEPKREALVCGDERLSWEELARRAEELSGWLVAHGIGRGDRIALLLANGSPFVIALFAIARLGAVAVPVSIQVSKSELEYVLEDSAAVALLYEPTFQSLVPDRDLIDTLRLRVAFSREAIRNMAALVPPEPESLKEQDIAVIIYTSGTTGRPKGAMITHIGIIHSVMNYVRCMSLTAVDRFLIALPMSNITGIVALLLTATRAKGTMVVLTEFKAARFLSLAAAEKITHALLVPTMYTLCLLEPDLRSWDLSHWRVGAYGAAPMPSSSIAKLAKALPNLQLMNAYGATETTSPATLLSAEYATTRPTSVGRAVPGCEIAIMDGSGREVAAGVVGEVWIKGPMVAAGYWNNPIATDKEFVGGYWKSGDLGSIDEEGFVYIHDRKKDMINRGGYKIFSAEVEAQITAHPSVLEAAVVARECPVLGERVHAVVTLKADMPAVDAATLRSFVVAILPDYKCPESWTLTTERLPRNANGKVVKATLREQLSPFPLRPRSSDISNQ